MSPIIWVMTVAVLPPAAAETELAAMGRDEAVYSRRWRLRLRSKIPVARAAKPVYSSQWWRVEL